MIAGATVGAVIGVAALILAAIFLFRRRRQAQYAPHQPPSVISAFEPTEDVQVIVPYPASAGASTQSVNQRGGPDTTPLLATAGWTDLTPQDMSGGEKLPPSDRGSASEPSEQANSPAAASRPPQRAEDMEDAEVDRMLPPEYKEAWGQRHSAALEDAGAVSRFEKRDDRAEDGAPL